MIKEVKFESQIIDVRGIADPFGNIIFIADDFTVHDEITQDQNKLSETAAVVIEKPIHIIKIGTTGLYYFKRIESNTILVHSEFMQCEWLAKKMIYNPDPEYIYKLLKEGRLLTSFN
jgi:hypothetical protein